MQFTMDKRMPSGKYHVYHTYKTCNFKYIYDKGTLFLKSLWKTPKCGFLRVSVDKKLPIKKIFGKFRKITKNFHKIKKVSFFSIVSDIKHLK